MHIVAVVSLTKLCRNCCLFVPDNCVSIYDCFDEFALSRTRVPAERQEDFGEKSRGVLCLNTSTYTQTQ